MYTGVVLAESANGVRPLEDDSRIAKTGETGPWISRVVDAVGDNRVVERHRRAVGDGYLDVRRERACDDHVVSRDLVARHGCEITVPTDNAKRNIIVVEEAGHHIDEAARAIRAGTDRTTSIGADQPTAESDHGLYVYDVGIEGYIAAGTTVAAADCRHLG